MVLSCYFDGIFMVFGRYFLKPLIVFSHGKIREKIMVFIPEAAPDSAAATREKRLQMSRSWGQSA